jgi:GntR family transcriptional regulator
MDFKPNYPIYLQVADHVCEKVLRHEWPDGHKLPSVKELSIAVAVNPNTVIKALGYLQDNGILTTQRGIGYFLTDDAHARTLQVKRRQFIEDELPGVFATMRLLHLDLSDLERLLAESTTHLTGSEQ